MPSSPIVTIVENESLIAFDLERIVLEAYPEAAVTMVTSEQFEALDDKQGADIWIIDISRREESLPPTIKTHIEGRVRLEFNGAGKFLIASKAFAQIELLEKPYDDEDIVRVLKQFLD